MATKKTKKTTPEVPAPSDKEVAFAVTNAPELSPTEFMLGDQKIALVDLGYDDYVKFMFFLKPLLASFQAALNPAQKQSMSIPDIELAAQSLSATKLLHFCEGDLPEMALIIVKQTRPDLKVEDIKRLAGNPFTLATLVLRQVIHNRMIQHFASFFVPMLSLMTKMKQGMTRPTESPTTATPSS